MPSRILLLKFFIGLSLSVSQIVIASDEDQLRRHFSGMPVAILIDLPSTRKGLDLYPHKYPEASRAWFDSGEYREHLIDSGVGVQQGEVIYVTEINVKGKHIEFHLGAGGTSQRPEKQRSYESGNQLTRELERQLNAATIDSEKRKLRAQLNDERRRLRREQDILNDMYEEQYQKALSKHTKEEWDLMAGSRINIRFDGRVPTDALTPEGLMEDLKGFVDFNIDPIVTSDESELLSTYGATPLDWFPLRKGLTIDEVDSILGTSESFVSCEEQPQGSLKVTVCYFKSDEATLKINFVDGVLVRYALTSN